MTDAVAVSRNKALADFVAQVVAGATTGVKDDMAERNAGFRCEFVRGAIRLRTSRPLEMKVSLADLRGKESLVLAEGRFDAGWNELLIAVAMWPTRAMSS